MKKRVVFFIESFSGGGAERVLLTILRNINKEKFDVTVLVMTDIGAQKDEFHKLGIRIVDLTASRSRFLGNVKYKLLYDIVPTKIVCWWALRGIKADTYVAFVEGYCTRLFSKVLQSKKKIAWVHIDLETFPWTLENGIFGSVMKERDAYQKYDEVIGVSESVTDMLISRYGLHNAKTIYNPIDEKRIRRLSENKCPIDIDRSKFNIVTVGRLTRQKGYDKLIRLFPDILAANPDIRLYIIGEGEDRDLLESEIKEFGLQGNVVLTGFMNNPYSLMKVMDLFICSSLAEGFSLVIAEAMTIGLPVVSMECAGPCELLGNGKYGILCSSYDMLRDSVISLSKDENKLSELKNKAIRRRSSFDTESIVSQIECIL